MALFSVYGKDGWVDETMDFKTFGEEKKLFNEKDPAAKMISGSLPQLNLPSGKRITQSHAMARYVCMVGRKQGTFLQLIQFLQVNVQAICFVEILPDASTSLQQLKHNIISVSYTHLTLPTIYSV